MPPVPPRDEMLILVVNGSYVNGSAGRMTEALQLAGFDPLPAGDARTKMPETVIWYPPGKQEWAAEVNRVVNALPENVREADPDDENWQWFSLNWQPADPDDTGASTTTESPGAEPRLLDILVVIGGQA